jgi:hypothetical protein
MPTPPKKQSKSHVVSFRINEGTPRGEAVLKLLSEYKADGREPGEVFQEALIQFGHVELPKRTTMDKIARQLEQIQDMIAEGQEYMEQLIRESLDGLNLGDYQNSNGESLEAEVGDRITKRVHEKILGGLQGKKYD